MNWKAWLHVAERIAPFVLGTIPGIPPRLVQPITNAIGEAQQIEGASGADKKAHVLAAIGDIDPAIAPVVSSGIDTAVGVVQLVHAAHGEAIATAPVG